MARYIHSDYDDAEPRERPSAEEVSHDAPHYDPGTTRALNAAAVAGAMRERVPNAESDEVATAAMAWARVQWGDPPVENGEAAPYFWAESVLVNWRLGDTDRPF